MKNTLGMRQWSTARIRKYLKQAKVFTTFEGRMMAYGLLCERRMR